jgi:hypothetical protein
MCFKSRFLTPVGLVMGLGVALLVTATPRSALARPGRTSPCHRGAVADPDLRCPTKRAVVRREAHRVASRSAAVATVRSSSSRPASVDRAPNRRLNKRRATVRRLGRRSLTIATDVTTPAATTAAPATTVGHGPGWVSIESKPGHVRVYINGQKVGLTPLQVQLTEGRHTIEAVRDDGVRQRRIIDIEAGQQRFLVLVS